MTQAQTLGYAEGGDVSNYRQDQVALNLDNLPALNLMLAGKPIDPVSTSRPNNFGNLLFPGMGNFMRNPFSSMRGLGRSAPPTPIAYALNLNSGQQEAQYAKGGYLNGQGDGMSDSIPATIEGKQPARLADGEFVVPADVVSHLGNGSSKAGSKKLYAMMDKVRHARTGNKKQGKQINPDKYLPKIA
jgi:hypothetical protein